MNYTSNDALLALPKMTSKQRKGLGTGGKLPVALFTCSGEWVQLLNIWLLPVSTWKLAWFLNVEVKFRGQKVETHMKDIKEKREREREEHIQTNQWNVYN